MSDAAPYEQPVIPGLEAFAPPPGMGRTQQALAIAQGRARLSEELYQASGRSDRAHPMHGIFTGLWEEICLKAGRVLLEHALLHPDEVQITGRIGAAPSDPPERAEWLPLEQAIAIREQAHADAAESIRLQREADRLRASYFRGLAALEPGPEGGLFAALGERAACAS